MKEQLVSAHKSWLLIPSLYSMLGNLMMVTMTFMMSGKMYFSSSGRLQEDPFPSLGINFDGQPWVRAISEGHRFLVVVSKLFATCVHAACFVCECVATDHFVRMLISLYFSLVRPELLTTTEAGARCQNWTELSVSQSLTHLFNESLLAGQFPCAWKKSKSNTTFQRSTETDCDNYRPISVLPSISKILESLTNSDLQIFAFKSGLIEQHQLTYSKFSTTVVLLKVVDSWKMAIDKARSQVSQCFLWL